MSGLAKIKGRFLVDEPTWPSGEDVRISLELENTGDQEISVIVPPVHSVNLGFIVLAGGAVDHIDTALLPEEGFGGQVRIGAGARHKVTYSLKDRVRLRDSGAYVIACSATVQAAGGGGASRVGPAATTIANEVQLLVEG